MCRCCQNCWEDFYWNCIEERFCYDESIANYNPEEDEDYIASQKNGGVIAHIEAADNNNLTVPPICDQPLRRGNSAFLSDKIHEEDFRRETQTNVPMLGPETLAVFANSQIFQDHPQAKINRSSTKSFLVGVHSPKERPSTPKETDQERLLRRLEANLHNDVPDATKTVTPISAASHETTAEKRITFTLTTDSSPEGSQILTPKKFAAIAEEETETDIIKSEEPPVKNAVVQRANASSDNDTDEVILRPRFFDRHQHLMPYGGGNATPKRTLRSAKSVPHFNVRAAASETDIFSITGSVGQISMTPEVPSISYSNLPKNYEDTPTIEEYRVSQSLYSIQATNAARATQDDYSMPRYFRRSAMLAQSTEILSASSLASVNSSKEEMRRPEKEKSKRLKMLRGNLPPLLIHSVSFRKNRDEGKQLD
ncbi:uncharacterized protein LOC119687407 [Teleopsis dalmanni]|uniref:uncharacterized protein LOC119687407 n=1 Tax=Teleopsis dalmanni TaxID=139649 RepID=UPI0018CCC4BF|nr:uncharacterized protein LOC119687407 [Teleopsis dalmanni]